MTRPTPPASDSAPVLLSLGSINADFQFHVDEDLGQRETLQAHGLLRLSGGKAANRAVIARRLGHPAWLLGRVGDDELAAQALDPLRELGIDVAGVCRGGEGTALSFIAVLPGGKKRIVLAGRANLDWRDADLATLEERLGNAPPNSVLVADYEVDPRAASRAVAVARRLGLKVVVDPSFPDAVPRDDLGLIDALTPNTEEALALAQSQGKPDDLDALQAAARRLCSWGVATVCVKLGDGGALVVQGDQCWHEKTVQVDDVVDTTGAGDAFTGAFAVALLEARDVRDAARRGVAASEHAVTKWGSQAGYADTEQLEARLRLDRRSADCERGSGQGG